MKKLKSTIPNGGAPIGRFPVLRELFDTETKEAIEALFFSVVDGRTEGVVLKGCTVSGTSGNFDISAGYVYLNGKVLRYPGGTGFSATRYIAEATTAEEGGIFADGITKNYIDVEVSEDLASAPGSGQYITVTFADGGQTFNNLLVTSNEAILNDGNTTGFTETRTAILEIGDWDMDTVTTRFVSLGSITPSSVRSLSGMVRNDANDLFFPFGSSGSNAPGAQAQELEIERITGTDIRLTRGVSSSFDSVDFDSTSYNRGWITVIYEA